jgi:hypothetical protein
MSRTIPMESAFPREDYQSDAGPGQRGMTLRDYFAGQALIGLFAQNAHPDAPGVGNRDYLNLAWEAYQVADAMLNLRSARVRDEGAQP